MESIYIPVSYPDRTVLAKQERFRLLITKNKNGERNASIIHYIADNSYYDKSNHISTADFTGIILTYDFNDKFIYGLRYNNAKVIGDVTPAVNKNVIKKTSIISPLGDCTTITVVYYSQACVGSNCNDPVVVGTDTYTFCAGGGGGGGGGGGPIGGGGTGTDCGDAVICPDGTTNGLLKMDDGILIPLHINISQGGINANHIEATLKVENGQLTNVTSHMSGLTAGATYVQTDWVQNGVSNNVYTFSFAFHASFSIPILGIGDLGANDTAIAHCTYDSNLGTLTVFFEKP